MSPTEIQEAPIAASAPNLRPFTMMDGTEIDLPQQLVDLIAGTIKEFQKQDSYLRRREVQRDRKARFYERGYQHLTWQGTGTAGGFALVTAGMQVAGDSATVQAPRYVDDYDIFYPYERIPLAILTQNPPGVAFQPNDPNSTVDIEAANTAEGYTKIFDRNNNIKSLQTQALRMMMLGGRSIAWTRTEANRQKFGVNDEGNPRSVEITTIYGTLESRVPIMSKNQDEALFVGLIDDPPIRKARAEYPWIKEKIQGNESALGENQYERLARLGALQGSRQPMASGESYSYLTARSRWWLRPEVFHGKEYEAELEQPSEADLNPDGSPMTCGEKILSLVPEGACFAFVGSTYAQGRAESMDDHLDISFAIEGDGMFRKAPMDCMMVNQDAVNDNMNAARVIFDVGWPSRWVSADQQEFDTIVGQTASPYAFRLKKVPAGGSLKDVIEQEKNPELPVTFVNYNEYLQGTFSQFQTATPPALWGADMEDQKTAHGYAQAQQSAMGQLGLIWASLQYQFSRIRYQSALCASKNQDYAQPIVIPGEGETASTLQLSNIDKGNFRCYPDEDSSFPETTAAQRATLSQVMDMLVQAQSPVGAQIMGSPDNVSYMLQKFGLWELTVPEAEARDAQQIEIEQLLQGAPTVSEMAVNMAMEAHAQQALMGVPGVPVAPFDVQSVPPDTPSVPINEYDYHQWHAMKCQDWLNGNDCRKQKAAGNDSGILNVVLHWKAHVTAMAALMPPPMPAEGEEGKGEAPPEKEKGEPPSSGDLAGPPPGTPPGPPPGPPLV